MFHQSTQPAKHSLKPSITPWLAAGFRRYSRRLLRKRFHALWLAKSCGPAVDSRIDASKGLIVYANHASWWDPLTAVVVNEVLFPGRRFYAPVDAVALQKYKVLSRLGFFPLERHSHAGIKTFLLQMQELLADPAAAVYITPEGQFADPRRLAPFDPGLAHVVSRCGHAAAVLPLAIEYPFWNESSPEIAVEFGEPILPTEASLTKQEWNELFETKLRQTQASLAEKVIARDPSLFKPLLGGNVGVGGLYDLSRRMASWFAGRKFDAAHEQSFSAKEQAG